MNILCLDIPFGNLELIVCIVDKFLEEKKKQIMRGIEPKLSLGESRTKKIMSNFYINSGKTRFLTEI